MRGSAIGTGPGQSATYMDDASWFVRENHASLNSRVRRPVQNNSMDMNNPLDLNLFRGEERQQIDTTLPLVGTLDFVAGLHEPILIANLQMQGRNPRQTMLVLALHMVLYELRLRELAVP